jgi:hypothetical protein
MNVGLRGEGKAPITADQIQAPAPVQEVEEEVHEAEDAADVEQEREMLDMDSVPEGACLFCSQVCDDMEANVVHMKMAHGFTFPMLSNLTDELGMLRYLQFKVFSGLCLWCNGKGRFFRTTEGVQAHMRDHGHCGVQYLGEEDEYADFYGESLNRVVSVDDDGSLVLADGRRLQNKVTVVHKHRPTFTRLRNDVPEEELAQKKLLLTAKAAHMSPGTLVKREEQRARTEDRHAHQERAVLRKYKDLQIATMIRGNKLFDTKGRVGDN